MKRCNILYKPYMMFMVLMLSIGFYSSVSYAEDNDSRETAHKMLIEIRQNISVLRERISFLNRQVIRLKKDQRTLTDELIKVAKEEHDIENNITERKKKLEELIKQQAQVHQNLKNSRTEFTEVLAILERMGLNPPPAIIVSPEDILISIRSSVLLGAVIPKMQEKTLVLSANLKKLTNLSYFITAECTALRNEIQNQAEQRKHLELLLSEKAKLQKKSEKELIEQQQKNRVLSKKAQSLEELILQLEHESQFSVDSSTQMQKNIQLLKKLNFESQKGSLLLPVSGKKIQRFNSSSHATRFGEIIETEPAALVTTPADALVAFAGTFRSYGQIIILNVGSGYHIILAGMEKINVTQGQFVFAGEPLGVMSTQFVASTVTLDIGKNALMLYIEFRKDGKPVNPTPWWRTEKLKRDKNDS
ncbi:murein hydrolase activator EnvC family protein [Bartonella sp. WD16.2]|uniref:murein hydrolase activator EnvC family protein n=1 Tax=Bartonella sp. WD16.2 TaxID=1933904 RepID=UPI0009C30699|nr:peptidoglycan DD-metalloendopeptidase family protein [Bartonella sp. WD16.2]AQX19305.1 Septal ring factor EnvC, activator of murein hydrolases AmiA and AmiB [Bartonella sp. WD16.2]